MIKIKMIGVGVGSMGAVALLIVGGLLVTHKDGKKLVSANAAAGTTQAQAAGSDTAEATGSSLSVGGSNIGQLGSTGNQAAAGPNGNTGSGTSPGGAQLPDPSTFTQYDKYKDSKSAMFGEAMVGSGAELKAGMKAAVVYKGWLTNGQLFDQSKAGSDGKIQPFVFQMGANQVIPGWEQGLAGMKVGGTRLVIVPPAVGYGSTGQNGIPPNSVLIFAVQLLAAQ